MLSENPFRFSTKYQDESGWVYYGYRYLNPGLGRWASRDPIGEYAFYSEYAQRATRGEQRVLPKRFFESPAYLFAQNAPMQEYDPLGLYSVKKCTIVLFYGHGRISFFKDVEVAKCAGTTAVTCQSQIIFTYLDGVIPGAVHSDGNNVLWGGFGLLPPGTIKAAPLLKKNVAAMKAYAQVLLRPPCCCKKVKLKQKCVGDWWECHTAFSGSEDLPQTIRP